MLAAKGALATIAAGLLLVLLSRVFPPLGGLITSLITLLSSSGRHVETDISDPWTSYCMGAILVVIGCGWLAIVSADKYLKRAMIQFDANVGDQVTHDLRDLKSKSTKHVQSKLIHHLDRRYGLVRAGDCAQRARRKDHSGQNDWCDEFRIFNIYLPLVIRQ